MGVVPLELLETTTELEERAAELEERAEELLEGDADGQVPVTLSFFTSLSKLV